MSVPALADLPELLTTGEVAALFRVDPKTVTRWGNAGKLGPVVRTLGGHRRLRADRVLPLLERGARLDAPGPVVTGYEGQPPR